MFAREPDEPPGDKGHSLRDIFFAEEGDEIAATVGTVSIMLLQGSASKEVRIDHPFRSGDRFRFAVSANRGGWLYILHRSSAGAAQQLWPQKTRKEGIPRHHEIKAWQTLLIPPRPGLFVFDEDTGQEEFTIAIRSKRSAPDLTSLDIGEPEQPTDPVRDKQPTGNIVIRGNLFGRGAIRGIAFDPGIPDGDPRLYFREATGDADTTAIVTFRLRHAE
jgi:hypothetical protein